MAKNKQQILKWQEVKKHIEIKIILSEFKAGERLPTSREIMEQYGVATTTAMNVLQALYKEGIIMKSGKTSTYYVKPLITTALKKKHMNDLKQDAEKIIAQAKIIQADYEDVKPIFDLVDEYRKVLDSGK